MKGDIAQRARATTPGGHMYAPSALYGVTFDVDNGPITLCPALSPEHALAMLAAAFRQDNGRDPLPYECPRPNAGLVRHDGEPIYQN